jgi:hypothetical protein
MIGAKYVLEFKEGDHSVTLGAVAFVFESARCFKELRNFTEYTYEEIALWLNPTKPETRRN